MDSFRGKGVEMVVRYINEEKQSVMQKLEGSFGSHKITSEEILRVWKNYVGPKFELFDHCCLEENGHVDSSRFN